MKEHIFLTESSFNQTYDDCACPDNGIAINFDYNDPDFQIENDCACSDHGYLFDTKVRNSPPYTLIEGLHSQSINNEFTLVFSPYAPGGPTVLNQIAFDRLMAFREPQLKGQDNLTQKFIKEALISPHKIVPKVGFSQGETLTVWMHVTNACNLDCPYCYVRKSTDHMPPAVAKRALDSTFQTAQKRGFKRIKLKYAGGESTLQFDHIRKIHERAQQMANAASLELTGVVLSNGFKLESEDMAWLKHNQVKLMISLDGIGEAHDQQRPQKGGGGTFAKIANNIDNLLLPNGITPDITITITGKNASTVAETVEWCLIRKLPISLNFYRENLEAQKNFAHAEIVIQEEQAIINGLREAYAVFEEYLPARPFLNGLLDRVQTEAHGHTCGVQNSYLVFTHTGQVGQCQMHLDQSVSLLGTNQSDDLLNVVSNGPIKNLPVTQKEGCKTCEFRFRCTGGCPLETYQATGRWDVKSPHCNIYKTLYPEALRLEGLRLLKVNKLLPIEIK